MNFEMDYQPYGSNRFPVVANRGMVATATPLAASAGLEILRKGGNAVDAAIATAAALTVVEPTSNGIGSDAFAIVWFKDKLYGVNGSGRAPKNISIEKVMEKGAPDGKMPLYGWTPVTVSGAPGTWAALSKRFGNLPFLDVLEPAIRYAREGYPVSPTVAGFWKKGFDKYSAVREQRPEFEEWFKTFAPDGRPPMAGETVTLKNHGNTLEEIGCTGGESFYRGDLAKRIVSDCKKHGGFLTEQDYRGFEVSWVDPLRMEYRGYEICEIPPNGQGIVALMALNILKNFEFSQKEDVETYHRQMEAIKMAFADGIGNVTDPSCMKIRPEQLLDAAYGKSRSQEITGNARLPKQGEPPKGGTVYLCTADGEGNMVSMIQSNYMGFGSGIVVEGTGISLQNRGCDFSLDPNHVNALMPGKKTYHTIIPGFIMKDGKAVGPFGVMGAYMQPQGHVQVAMNLIDFHLNPQMALDAPRWRWMTGNRFLVEPSFDMEMVRQLVKRGHEIEVSYERGDFGRGQVIIRLENGTLVGGAESRADSNIACY